MECFKIKRFIQESKKAKLPDKLLNEAMDQFQALDEKGQQKLALGAGLYKLRMAVKSGRGKSGGARSILAYKQGKRLVWLHLFSKNHKGNVTTKELSKLKTVSNLLLGFTRLEMEELMKQGEIEEVQHV